MPEGCTNPAANNYDPAATTDDGSCYYIKQVDDVCYRFEDYDGENILDKSFTVSFAVEKGNWVFFHDYIPNFYFHTREKLHLSANSEVYTANEGPRGAYLGQTVKPFFIDIVLNYKEERVLDTLKWITENITTTTEVDQEFDTFTHITIWNNYQCTGKIPLAQVFDGLEVSNLRRTKSEWSFNDFRDLVAIRGAKFLKDILDDFAVETSQIDQNLPWYEKKLLEDQYFIVRLEYDNSADNIVLLHEVEGETTISNR